LPNCWLRESVIVCGGDKSAVILLKDLLQDKQLLETLKIRERGASGEFYSVIWLVFLENSSKNSD
jgi:hypothetical protein